MRARAAAEEVASSNGAVSNTAVVDFDELSDIIRCVGPHVSLSVLGIYMFKRRNSINYAYKYSYLFMNCLTRL